MASTKEVEVPDPLTLVVAGQPVTVTYQVSWNGSLHPTYTIPAAVAEKLRGIEEVLDLEIHSNATPYHGNYRIVDPDGTEIVSNDWPWSLLYDFREAMQFRRLQATRPGFTAVLERLKVQAETLKASGLYVHGPATALKACQQELSHSWLDVAAVSELLGQARRVIGDLTGPFIEVVVRGLVDKTLYHRDIAHNNAVRDQLTVMWIRSGSNPEVDRLSDEEIGEIYRQKLTAADVKTLADVTRTNLGIEFRRYFDMSVYADEIEFAPEELAVTIAGQTHRFTVKYQLVDVGGQQVPRGIVQMPLNQYNRIKTPLALLHGIELYLELTIQQGNNVKVVVTGVEGEQLHRRIKQRG